MSFSIDIEKTVGDGQGRFTLKLRFTSSAPRIIVYGPSGAGKSMLLQILAGLLTPDCGHVSFGEEVIFDSQAAINLPARARRFGYLFQDYALFPQLSVRQNIAFALRDGWLNPRPAVTDAC